MIGNVLAEFSCPRSALAACYQLNGRFYGGQKLTIDFCQNLNWRTAVCGTYEGGDGDGSAAAGG